MKIYLGFILITIISCKSNTFNIPTPSMEGTIPIGSKVTVDKLTKVKRNDIIVLQVPKDTGTFYVFRLIAKEGDSLRIKNYDVFVNNSKMNFPNTIQFSYTVEANQSLSERFFSNNNIKEFHISEGHYLIHTGEEAFNNLKNNDLVDTIYRNHDIEGIENSYLHPAFQGKGWNKDFFGPLYIPKEGVKIKLDESNKKLYQEAILKFEQVDITNLEEYQFKKDYIFVMGDNRDNTFDSRFMGFIPKECILGIGKVMQ